MHAGNELIRQHSWCVSVQLSKHECVMSKVLVLRLPVLQPASPMQQGSANCEAAPSGSCSSWQPCLYVYVKRRLTPLTLVVPGHCCWILSLLFRPS